MSNQIALSKTEETDLHDTFEWPDTLAYCAPAATSSFLEWLKEVKETGEMSWRHLKTLYLEYCCIARRKPLSDRALQIKLKQCGVVSSRPKVKVKDGQLHRPSVYMI